MTGQDQGGGGAGKAGGQLAQRSLTFRLAQQLAIEVAREGKRPGRYEIAVTAQVWPGDQDRELQLADVVYTWRWYDDQAAQEPPAAPEMPLGHIPAGDDRFA